MGVTYQLVITGKREYAMKKLPRKRGPDMQDEYDFSKGARGKYAKRFAKPSNFVVLDADVTAYFPDAETVNEALRTRVKIVRRIEKTNAR